MIVDLFLVYQFVRRLATPFDKWDAFKEGVIDKDGNILVKKNRRGGKQNTAFGLFDVMVLNMKKLLGKLPGGSSKIASYAAALFLIKEYKVFTDDSLLNEDMSEEDLSESISIFNDLYVNYTTLAEDVNLNVLPDSNESAINMRNLKLINKIKKSGVVKSGSMSKVDTKPEIKEEPVNNVSGGDIAGMDGGHMSKAGQKKWTGSNKSNKKKRLRDIMGVPK